jgi:thymidylate kinase
MINIFDKYNIVFSGSQGTGKTTLSKSWSDKHSVEFSAIETRKFMPNNINNHLDVIKLSVNNPQSAIDFQTNLIRLRSELFTKNKSEGKVFTSDRAVVDSYIYYLMHNSMFDDEDHNTILKNVTYGSVLDIDCTVVINTSLSSVDNDEVRITNLEYNKLVGFNIWRTTTDIYYKMFGAPVSEYRFTEGKVDMKLFIFKSSSKFKAYINLNEKDGMGSNESRILLIEKALLILNNHNTTTEE